MCLFNTSRCGRKNQQCQLQCSNLASEAHGKPSRGQTIHIDLVLTSQRPRIGPEFQSESRYTAHEILVGVALRSRLHIQICLSVLEVRSISKSQRSMGTVSDQPNMCSTYPPAYFLYKMGILGPKNQGILQSQFALQNSNPGQSKMPKIGGFKEGVFV